MILEPSQIYAKRFTTITVTVFANLTNKQNKLVNTGHQKQISIRRADACAEIITLWRYCSPEIIPLSGVRVNTDFQNIPSSRGSVTVRSMG